MTVYSWKTATSGDWATSGLWNPAGIPNATSADAVLGVSGSYAVTLDGGATYTVDSLKLTTAGATLDLNGTLDFAGAKTLTVSVGTLDLTGTVIGAVISNTGGVVQYSGGTLEGVTYRGTLDLSAPNANVTIANGITLTGASGTGAGAVNLGSSSQMYVEGKTTLNTATITIAGGEIYNYDTSGTGQILTLGSGLTVQDAVSTMYLYAGGVAGDGIVNQGKIIASTSGGYAFVAGNSFANQGSIAVSNGDTLTISATTFSNTGTITVNAATLVLSGTETGVGKITSTGGTVDLEGNLINTGTTLSIGAGSALGTLTLANDDSTITGGIIADGGDGLEASGGTLTGVTYRGTLALGADESDDLYISNGLTLTGSGGTGAGAMTVGSASYVGQAFVENNTTLNNATITLTYGYLYNYDTLGTGLVLTLGSGLTLQDGGYGYVSTYQGYAGDGIVNQGKIVAGFSGGQGLTIAGTKFTNQGSIAVSNGDTLTISATSFSNTGTITVNAATLVLSGTETGVGKITSTGGTVDLEGNLINTGTTLSIGAGSALGTLTLANDDSTITGGIIADGGDGLEASSGTLTGVTYRGTLALGADESDDLYISNGLTLTGSGGTGAGAMTVGSASYVGQAFVESTTTLNNATITLTYGYLYNYDTLGTGLVLTLGSGLTLQDGGYGYVSTYQGYAGDGIVNQGKIVAGFSGGQGLTIAGTKFTNQGSIAVSNGDTLTISATTFSNTGTITVNAATLVLSGTETGLGKVTSTGGTVDISGDLVNTGATLSIGAGSSISTLAVAGYGTITGGIIADGGDGLEASRGTLEGVTYRGTLALGADESDDLYISNGLTLTGSGGTGAGAMTVGSASYVGQVFVENNTTLNNATITLTYGYLYNYDTLGTGLVLTLGSGLTLQDGGYGYVSTFQGYAGDGIVNQGKIVAGFSGGQGLTIAGTKFTNQGSIAVSNGDSLHIEATTFTNISGTTLTGGTYAVAGASTLEIQTASITTLNASVTLSGAGSVFEFYNTMTDTTATLDSTLTTIGASGALSILGSRGYTTTKTVTDNGRVVLNGGSFVSAGTLTVGATGTLSGYGSISRPIANAGLLDAVGGTLALTGAVTGAGALRADAGAVLQLNEAAITALSGRVTLNGTGSVIEFGTASPFKTLETSLASISATGTLAVLGGRGFTSSNTLTDSGLFNIAGGTATIASLVVASGGRILGSGVIANVVADSGTIESNGGLLKLAAGATGTGTLLVDAASTLELAAVTAAGTVTDSGILKLDGQTYTFTAATVATVGKILGFGTLADATASSGTIESNGGMLKLAAGATGTGTLLVDAASTLELAATTAAATLTDSGLLKLDGAIFTFTTGTVATAGKILGFGTFAKGIASSGTIESNGGLLKLAAGATGTGALTVDAGSTLELATATSAGTISDSGVLKLDGLATTATTTTLATTGLIQGFGSLSGTVADGGTIDAKSGLLKLSGSVSGTGALQIENAATLELGAAAAQAVTFATGAVATLQLDAQASFTGAIKGLAVGDAITFSNETVSSAVVSGTTLTVVGSAGTTTYQVAGALAGNHFAVQSNDHTITLVTGPPMQPAKAAFIASTALSEDRPAAWLTEAAAWHPSDAVLAGPIRQEALAGPGISGWHDPAPALAEIFVSTHH